MIVGKILATFVAAIGITLAIIALVEIAILPHLPFWIRRKLED